MIISLSSFSHLVETISKSSSNVKIIGKKSSHFS